MNFVQFIKDEDEEKAKAGQKEIEEQSLFADKKNIAHGCMHNFTKNITRRVPR